MEILESFVAGEWIRGNGSPHALHNPTTEETVAETSTAGKDIVYAWDAAARLTAVEDRTTLTRTQYAYDKAGHRLLPPACPIPQPPWRDRRRGPRGFTARG